MAHKLHRLIDKRKLKDRAELARQPGASLTRITRILAPTLLAPGNQEEVLFVEAIDRLKPVVERRSRDPNPPVA